MNLQVDNLESIENNYNPTIKNKAEKKIKILIADDYKPFCETLRNILNGYDGLKVIGLAHTDQEEIEKIEELKPNVVITDIKRNNQYTGLDIVKQYENKEDSPYFFVISSAADERKLNPNPKIIGFMSKPFLNYDKIVEEILKVYL